MVERSSSARICRGSSCTPRMVKGAEHYLNEDTRFWVVRPRIAPAAVSGLGTLLSGAYIGIDPAARASATRELHRPRGAADRHYRRGRAALRAALRASSARCRRGSPVYYRNIQVGQVVAYELGRRRRERDHRHLRRAPRTTSGCTPTAASGTRAASTSRSVPRASTSHVESLRPCWRRDRLRYARRSASRASRRPRAASFPLFDSFGSVTESRYTKKLLYEVYFDGSVRGLRAGAPVEFRGMRIGSVTDVRLEIDPTQETVRIPVTFGIEPERIIMVGGTLAGERYAMMSSLVARGLGRSSSPATSSPASCWSTSISIPRARRPSSTRAAPIPGSRRCRPSWRC